MKKLILFDIDRTLIDTGKLSRNLSNVLHKKCNVSLDNFLLVKDEYKNGLSSTTDFSPQKFCRLLSIKFNTDYKELLRSYYHEPLVYQGILYPDTIPALQRLSKDYNLGIFSEGFYRFQITKLKFTKILQYFDKRYVYILRRKTTKLSLEKLPHNCTIIDDNTNVINKLTSKKDIKSVLISRGTKEKQNGIILNLLEM